MVWDLNGTVVGMGVQGLAAGAQGRKKSVRNSIRVWMVLGED